MIHIKKLIPRGKKLIEETQLLGSLNAGDCFRFTNVTVETAMEKPGENFYRICAAPPSGAKETARTFCISLDCRIMKSFDDNHVVTSHDLTINIADAEQVESTNNIEDQSETS